MTKAIRYERRAKFALEGIRFFDLKRWTITKQTLDGFVHNPLTPDIKSVYPPYYDIWPIPQSEIDYNQLLLNDHNAGYNYSISKVNLNKIEKSDFESSKWLFYYSH